VLKKQLHLREPRIMRNSILNLDVYILLCVLDQVQGVFRLTQLYFNSCLIFYSNYPLKYIHVFYSSAIYIQYIQSFIQSRLSTAD
jgi:hypothetical protein